jgi:serine protease Do
MRRYLLLPLALTLLAVLLLSATPARTDQSFAAVAEEVNKKLVKLFGAGGFRGLASYGTGVLVSHDGGKTIRIVTINSHILDTRDLRIHLYDGTRYHGVVVAREPQLDIAVVEFDTRNRKVDIDHFFNIEAAAKRPIEEPGTGILAFSNQFQIATRDEPMSVQRGVIAAYSKLLGRIGVFEAAYHGDVYVVDAITNNPGAGGGAITTRRGELVALIGKELRNELTNTWINYAIPLSASVEVPTKEGKKIKVSVIDLVRLGKKYNPLPVPKKTELQVFHGMVLVPNVVERTPPYIEEVVPGSPADRAKLKPDDLIVYIDGLPTPDINTLNRILAGYHPNQELKLEVQRGDKLTTVPLKLEKLPEKKKKK